MANRIISDLIGTLSAFFRFGTIRLKDSSGTMEVRNKADTGYAPVGTNTLKIKGSSSGEVAISAPATVDSGTYVWPSNDGDTNQVLQTNGTGTLTWATVATANNSVLSQVEIVEYNSSSPISMFTPPSNARILKVTVDVETAFDGTDVNLSVGVSGGTSRYLGTTDVELGTAAIYETSPMYEEDETADEVIITFNAGSGASQGSARVSVEYANPS